jgi:hypothetical protein
LSHRPPSQATVPLLNSPWSSPFSRILEAVSRPEFAQDHESGLRSDRGPVVLCDFSKLRFWKSPYKFFKFVWEILPIKPTIQPGKKSAPSLFLEDENIFQKSATLVVILLQFRLQPTWPIFEQCSHLREKGGVLMLFKTTHHLGAKAQYSHAHAGRLPGTKFSMYSSTTTLLTTSFMRNN